MDDLIYSFLLQSDFPRASVMFDIDLFDSAARVSADMKVPSFVIVDPDNAEMLAVIEVVDAIDGDTLRQTAIETGAYASRLGGKAIQGFVIRVDVRGRTEAEQVQFFRIWPNSTLQQLSSKTFPDLDTLRVARRLYELKQESAIASMPQIPDFDELETDATPVVSNHPGAGMYLPALVLLLIIVAESVFSITRGVSLLTVPQSVLAFGAALLLTLPAAIRYLRR